MMTSFVNAPLVEFVIELQKFVSQTETQYYYSRSLIYQASWGGEEFMLT